MLILVACSAGSADCVARTLSCIADVLSEMAGDKAGLRSGPAANESWMHAYRLLEVRYLLFVLVYFNSSCEGLITSCFFCYTRLEARNCPRRCRTRKSTK
jgi:hypothetical protein